MSRPGFTKLHRRVEDHWLYNLGPWDAWHLWEHLWNVMASWEVSDDVHYLGRVHIVARGQLVTTLSHLSRKSGWTRPRVRRFLEKLEKADMIRFENVQGGILITICNYERWQGQWDPAITQSTRPRSGGVRAAITDKEEKKRRKKEVKKVHPRGAKRAGGVTKVGEALETTVEYFIKRALTCSPEAARFNLEQIEANGTKVAPEVLEALRSRAGKKAKKTQTAPV